MGGQGDNFDSCGVHLWSILGVKTSVVGVPTHGRVDGGERTVATGSVIERDRKVVVFA